MRCSDQRPPDRHGYCAWNVVRTTEQGRRIQTEKLIKIGVLGAVIGLVVNMGAGQTVNIVSVPIQLAWTDLIWAIPVSIVASLVIVAVRLPAYYLRNGATSVRRMSTAERLSVRSSLWSQSSVLPPVTLIRG